MSLRDWFAELEWKEGMMLGLASLIIFGFFVILGVLTWKDPDGQAVTLLYGTLSTAFGTVVGYFFGSSKGSADKNKMLQIPKSAALILAFSAAAFAAPLAASEASVRFFEPTQKAYDENWKDIKAQQRAYVDAKEAGKKAAEDGRLGEAMDFFDAAMDETLFHFQNGYLFLRKAGIILDVIETRSLTGAARHEQLIIAAEYYAHAAAEGEKEGNPRFADYKADILLKAIRSETACREAAEKIGKRK